MYFKKVGLLLGMVVLLTLNIYAMGESQVLSDDLSDLQLSETGHGVVTTINRQEIFIQKFDLETQQNIVATFNLSENFKLKNINALSQLSEGDIIEFSYYPKNDKLYLSRLVVHKQKPAKPVKEFDF